METGKRGQSNELLEYLAVLKARKWTFALVFVLVLGAVTVFSYRKPPRYQAQARVFVEPFPSSEPGVIQTPNLQTESQLVMSEPVASRVLRDLGLDESTTSLKTDLSVEALTDTEVLVITYTSPDREFARDAANSFSESYIDYRRDRTLERLGSAKRSLQTRVDAVQEELEQQTRKLKAALQAGNDARASKLEGQRGVLTTRLGLLQQRLDDVQPDRSITQGGSQVIQPATVPETPVSPNHKRDTTLGAVLGFILATGTVLVRERFDDRFRSRTDVSETIGAPLLATIPRFNGGSGAAFSGPIVAAQPKSAASESYRTLLTNIEFTMVQRNLRSLLLTSPSAEEGKTVTTANLGVAAAQAGRRVLLVSTDLRRPALETYFGVENRVGVSTWLAGLLDHPFGLVQRTTIDNLQIVASGPIPPNPAELLASPRLTELIATLEPVWDLVILDSPPTLPVADAMILASRVGMTLLVVNGGTTRRSSAAHAREKLQSVGGDIVGSILNGFDPAKSPYLYQSYYYAYPEYQSTEATPAESVEPSRTSKGTKAPLGPSS
jgi:polysaccharide biosynthesis transport protein